MTSTDRILAQIDTALGDWTVSPDAMRSRPAPEPKPAARTAVWMAPAGTEPGDTEAWAEIGYITDLDMTLDQATIDPAAAAPPPAPTWAEIVEVAEYINRIQVERARRAQVALAAFMQAVKDTLAPAVEQAGRDLSEAFRHLPEADGCNQCAPPPRRDRPAWQSPYGPARRRR